MIEVLLAVVAVVSITTLTIAIRALQSSRRSENLGEDRYGLLRDQHDRLELLREERRTFIEELERESQERQRLMETLKGAGPQLLENLERARQGNIENARRSEQEQERRLHLERDLHRLEEALERERQARREAERSVAQLEQEVSDRSSLEQQAERAAQDLQQLRGALERETDERLEAQRRAERLEQELGHSKEGPSRQLPAARPWWRKPMPFVALLFGLLIVWLTSLIVALNILNP